MFLAGRKPLVVLAGPAVFLCSGAADEEDGSGAIDEHEVRSECAGELMRLLPIGGVADELDLGASLDEVDGAVVELCLDSAAERYGIGESKKPGDVETCVAGCGSLERVSGPRA